MRAAAGSERVDYDDGFGGGTTCRVTSIAAAE
jgi:hypothetical protein